MKNAIKSIEFIEKLIMLTKEQKITWDNIPKYIDENVNEPLRGFVIKNNKYSIPPNEINNHFVIEEYDSFCAKVKDGVVIFISREKGEEEQYELFIQKSRRLDLEEIDSDNPEFQTKLEELIFLIKSDGTYSTETFIKNILDM